MRCRVAPPPILTWLTCFASPSWFIAAAESPPAMRLYASLLATARAISWLACAKTGISKTPIGPPQMMVLLWETIFLYSFI